MYKARIIDFYSIRSFHEMFNLSLMLMCSEIFTKVDIVLGKSSFFNLKCLCNNLEIRLPENISISTKTICEKETSWGAFVRTFMGGFQFFKEYIFLGMDTCLISNYCNPFALPFILLLNRFLRKRVVITCHGDLELLEKCPKTIWKPSFLYGIIFKSSFKYLLSKSNVSILVLGTSIKNNIIAIYPIVENNIIAINHPYIFSGTNELPQHSDTLIIGALGRLNKQKGLDSFLQIARHFNQQIQDGKLIVKSIGGKPYEINTKDWTNIKWGGECAMNRDEFEKEVNTLDYILCLYPVDSYKFTASGIIMDALRFLKPIIGLRNNFLKTIPVHYKIGYIGDTMDEVIGFIDKELDQKTGSSVLISEMQKVQDLFKISYNAQLFNLALSKNFSIWSL